MKQPCLPWLLVWQGKPDKRDDGVPVVAVSCTAKRGAVCTRILHEQAQWVMRPVRHADRLAVSQARFFGSWLLFLAQQVWRDNVSDAKRLNELETENTRRKKLLAESLLENETAK
ncbi:hypothetical protein LHGZ1_2383 [Laribacter hongkongensis]|uniref:Uncharacterized protein n=1 Tax=Laribacter hongkongensis TaxID=168471 RepID=A0A248LL96_9NEIS|nr:hypothetical protein LHGZ1_2383 [Laribacter hongkongensis]